MRARGILALGALALMAASPAAAEPIATLTELPAAARVIDIRTEPECLAASLPGARCLPAAALLGSQQTPPIAIPALRWLLGTIGLTGAEPVAIYPGDAPGALAVAALIHLAGQAEVQLAPATAQASTDRGRPRSFSREVVFTAPVRIEAMHIEPGPLPPLRQRLEAFARGTAPSVAFAPAM